MLPLSRSGQDAPRLTNVLTLEQFLQIWRIIQFFSMVDIAVVRRYSNSDYTTLLNSLVRVVPEQGILDMITAVGVDDAQAKDFLRLVAANVHRLGYLDLQYRPFLRIAVVDIPLDGYIPHSEIVYTSGLAATSNILRNVQIANQLRLAQLPSIFVDVVADLLRERFKYVTTNRRVESTEGATDVDVIVLEGNTLYLFEIKHSVYPAEPHELRDAWEDIEKGVQQLKRASVALEDPAKRHSYLAGWFPGRTRQENSSLRISSCLLSSHRILSGLELDGVPIRDYSSLARLVNGGVLSMGEVESDGRTLVRAVRLTEEEGFSAADLDDYLGSDSRYFNSFAPHLLPYSRLIRLGRLTISWETYLYNVGLDEWLAHMDTIGAVRLPDEWRKFEMSKGFDVVMPEE